MGSIDAPKFVQDRMKKEVQSNAAPEQTPDAIDAPAFVKKKEDLYSGQRPSSYPLPTSSQKHQSNFKPQLNLGEEEKPETPATVYNSASNFILQDLEKHPTILKGAPHPDVFKKQIIQGDGDINIQRYANQRLGEISKQQDELKKDMGYEYENFLGRDQKKITEYQTQIDSLEKQKADIKKNASEINDVQAVTMTDPPADPKDATEYFREIGRKVNKFTDPVGIANQEKHIKEGTNGARDKEIVDLENFTNERAGIEAKKKALEVDLESGKITPEQYRVQHSYVTLAENKLLANNPGARSVITRDALSKIIEDNRNKKSSKESDPNKVKPFSGSLFHNIISYTPSDDEVKRAIKQARAQGVPIGASEEEKIINDKAMIPGTSTLGNLYQSAIGSIAVPINNLNPFLSDETKESQKYVYESKFAPTQNQTKGVLGYVNQTANTVGTVLKWAALGRLLGVASNAALGSSVGAETAEGVDETLGGVKQLSEAQQHLSGTALTSGLLVYPEAKEEAKKFTTDESKQDAYAGTVTLLNTLAFTSLDPEGIVNKALGKMGTSDFTKEFLKVVNTKAGGINSLEPETFKKIIFNGIKKALGANLNATTTMTALNVAEQATNVMFGKKPEFDLKETANEAVNSFISFAPLSLMQGVVGSFADKNKRDVTIQLVNQAAKDPLAFKSYMDDAVKKGAISQQEANKKIQIVNSTALLRKSQELPEHLSEENKALYIDNLRRELEIKQGMKALDDEVQTKANNDAIKQLQEERKRLLNPEHEGGNLKSQPQAEDVHYWLKAADDEHDNTNDKIEFLSSLLTGPDENGPREKLGDEHKPAIEKAIEVLKGEQQDDLIQKYRDKKKVDKRSLSDDDLLKNIAAQAKVSYDQAVSETGSEDLVKAAMEKFPEEKLSAKQPDENSQEYKKNIRDDYFAKADFFTPEEKKKFETLDEAGQDKMIDDKREELAAKNDEIKVGEIMEQPIMYNGERARLYQDGQTVIAKIEGKNKEYEIGNVDEVKDHPISDYGIEHQTSVVNVDDEGNYNVRGEKYINPFEERGQSPLEAIATDKDGNVLNVRMKTEDGKRRTFRGSVAEDLAYQIHLKEITKDNDTRANFEKFINEDESAQKEINDAGLSEVTKKEPVKVDEPISAEEEIKKIEEEKQNELDKISKPEIKVELVPSKDLVNSKDPIANKEIHDEIKERYKRLKAFVDCL